MEISSKFSSYALTRGDGPSNHPVISVYPRMEGSLSMSEYTSHVLDSRTHESTHTRSSPYASRPYAYIADRVYVADVVASRARNISRSIEAAGHHIVELRCAYTGIHENGLDEDQSCYTNYVLHHNCISRPIIDSKLGYLSGMSIRTETAPDWLIQVCFDMDMCMPLPRAHEYAKHGARMSMANAGYCRSDIRSGVSWQLSPVELARIQQEAVTRTHVFQPGYVGSSDSVSGVIDKILNTLDHMKKLGPGAASAELLLTDPFSRSVREVSREYVDSSEMQTSVGPVITRSRDSVFRSSSNGIPITEGLISESYVHRSIARGNWGTDRADIDSDTDFNSRDGYVKYPGILGSTNKGSTLGGFENYDDVVKYGLDVMQDMKRLKDATYTLQKIGEGVLRRVLPIAWDWCKENGYLENYTGIALKRNIELEPGDCPIVGARYSDGDGGTGPMYLTYLIPKRSGSKIPLRPDPRMPKEVVRDEKGKILYNPRDFTQMYMRDNTFTFDKYAEDASQLVGLIRKLYAEEINKEESNYINTLYNELVLSDGCIASHGGWLRETVQTRAKRLILPWTKRSTYGYIVGSITNKELRGPIASRYYKDVPNVNKLEYADRGVLRHLPPIQVVLGFESTLSIGDFSEYAPSIDHGRCRSAIKAAKKAKATSKSATKRTEMRIKEKLKKADKREIRRRRNHPEHYGFTEDELDALDEFDEDDGIIQGKDGNTWYTLKGYEPTTTTSGSSFYNFV